MTDLFTDAHPERWASGKQPGDMQMPMFRKKPVVIEAVQFDGTFASVEGLLIPSCSQDLGSNTLEIETLEGVMTAQPGDWIIKGVKGEFYPCKPDIFAATYDAA